MIALFGFYDPPNSIILICSANFDAALGISSPGAIFKILSLFAAGTIRPALLLPERSTNVFANSINVIVILGMPLCYNLLHFNFFHHLLCCDFSTIFEKFNFKDKLYNVSCLSSILDFCIFYKKLLVSNI